MFATQNQRFLSAIPANKAVQLAALSPSFSTSTLDRTLPGTQAKKNRYAVRASV